MAAAEKEAVTEAAAEKAAATEAAAEKAAATKAAAETAVWSHGGSRRKGSSHRGSNREGSSHRGNNREGSSHKCSRTEGSRHKGSARDGSAVRVGALVLNQLERIEFEGACEVARGILSQPSRHRLRVVLEPRATMLADARERQHRIRLRAAVANQLGARKRIAE